MKVLLTLVALVLSLSCVFGLQLEGSDNLTSAMRVSKSSPSSSLSCLMGNTPNGLLALPGTAGYNDTTNIHNARLIFHPVTVALPKNETDVVSALKAAKSCNVTFAIVSGGHSAAGYCISPHGLTINLRSMDTSLSYGTALVRGAAGSGSSPHGVKANSGGDALQMVDTIRVPAGARFGDIYDSLVNYKNGTRLIVGGGCRGVAAGGFIQGGGWSFTSRMYGLAIDSLLKVRIILPNTTIATVTKQSDPDLFWALSGGGGGNFGTIVNYEVQLHQPVPDSTVGVMCWPQNETSKILSMFSQWIQDFSEMPKWVNIDPVWLPYGETGSRHFCWQYFCLNHPDACEPYTQALRAHKPEIDNVKVQPFLHWQASLGNKTSDFGGDLYVKSFMFTPENFTIETVQILVNALEISPSSKNLVLFHVSGGAVNEVPSNATAFPWRSSNLLMQIKAIWAKPEDAEANIKWANDIASSIQNNVTGAYINYIDRDLPNWKEAYYGDNYPRLLDIKRRVDPENLYRFNQSIGAGDY